MDAPTLLETFNRFAEELCRRQADLTQRWVDTVRADPNIPGTEPLSLQELKDHMPQLFDDLADTLRLAGASDARSQTERHAAIHGRHRWQQHYRLAELFRELGIVRRVILQDGVGEFIKAQPECQPHGRSIRSLVYRFFEEMAVSSVEQYVDEEQKAQRDLNRRLTETSEDLARTNDELGRIDASRLQMLRTVSHEMGNMLHALNGALSVLSMEYDDLDATERRDMLDICQRNLGDLKTLLAHLTDFSAFLRGKAQRDVSTFALPALFAELVATFRPQAEAQKLRFDATIDPALGEVRTDRLRVKQIASNLLSNAIKYRKRTGLSDAAPGRVALELRALASADSPVDAASDRWQIVVEDNGVGIAPDQHEAIFEEFHRLSANSEAPGAGLGLAISKRLAELLEGTITVDSELGRGSRFEVTLPRLLSAAGT